MDMEIQKQLDSPPRKNSEFVPALTPPAITTPRSRLAAALSFAACVLLLGLPASLGGIGEVWAVLVSAVGGSVVVYSTWFVKSVSYNQPLYTQDLVNLVAHMKETSVREGILLNYLRGQSLDLWELTYADAILLIKRASEAGDLVD